MYKHCSKRIFLKTSIVLFLLLSVLPSIAHSAEYFIVENGKPKAVIVISETATRMQRVAAEEFRMQIE